jgi:hypothetical protein|tara:strand:+ start:532 stop:690 length:159 start_codon:yes stop_codon:yes gene_type:complete
MDNHTFTVNNKKYNVTSEKDKDRIRMIHAIINGEDFDDEKPYRILALFTNEE